MRPDDNRRDEALHWLYFAMIVFAVTFLANVAVVALWPDSAIDWGSSVVIAGVVAITLTILQRTRER